MSERLRPRDLAFLDRGDADRRRGTTRRSRSSTPATSGFDYDRLRRADRATGSRSCRATASGCAGARAARQPGLGRRRALRPRLPRTPLGAAAAGQPSTSCASWSPGSCPGRSTGTGRCGRSTSSRGSRTAGSRCSPRPTRRSSTASQTVDLGQVLLDTDPGPARARRATSGSPQPAAGPVGARRWTRSATRSPTPPTRRRHRRAARRRRRRRGVDAVGPPGRPTVADALTGRRPHREHADQRHAVAAAPVRHRATPTSPTTARSARRTAARSTTSSWPPSPAALRGWLMTRAESLRRAAPGPGAWCRCRCIDERARGRPRSAARSRPHFVDLPVGEPSPVVRLHQVSYSFKAHKETGRAVAAEPARRHRRLRAVDLPRASARGSRPSSSRRGFQLSVTNVPGPQSPLYAAGRA